LKEEGLSNPLPFKKLKAMKIQIELTWSKFMALIILGCSVYLDIVNKSVNTFMFALPFVVFLITGKQFIDYRKENK